MYAKTPSSNWGGSTALSWGGGSSRAQQNKEKMKEEEHIQEGGWRGKATPPGNKDFPVSINQWNGLKM